MFDQRAIDETGLKKSDYIFLLLNYKELAKHYNTKKWNSNFVKSVGHLEVSKTTNV